MCSLSFLLCLYVMYCSLGSFVPYGLLLHYVPGCFVLSPGVAHLGDMPFCDVRK